MSLVENFLDCSKNFNREKNLITYMGRYVRNSKDEQEIQSFSILTFRLQSFILEILNFVTCNYEMTEDGDCEQ